MPRSRSGGPKEKRIAPAEGRATRRRSRHGRAAYEQILANLAHDIRTPLTGILAIAELLSLSRLGEREREWVEALKSSAEHLTALTSLVIDGAKARERKLVLRRVPFDLRRTIADAAAAAAARAANKGIAFSVSVAADVPVRVQGDRVRLRGAIENLLENAMKFTLEGYVRLGVAHDDADGVHHVTFTIEDSGIGLAKEEVRRIFRPFAQASAKVAERFGGSGLGLAYVKRLARAMGGDVTVTSEPGVGSTFRLTVQVEPTTEPPAEPEPDLDASAPGPALRILCVEDNAYSRIVLAAVLGELGHVTEFADSGDAAIDALRRATFDVVLMDVVLRGEIDGFETTRRIRALTGSPGRVPVVGVSGRSSQADAAAAREAGMTAYLQKPISPRALVKTLTAIRPAD